MTESPRTIHLVGSGVGTGRTRLLATALARLGEMVVVDVEVEKAPHADREYKLRVMRELTCQPEMIEDRKAHKAAMKKAKKKKPARGGGRP